MPQARTLWTGLWAVAVVLVSLSLVQATGAGMQDAAGFFSQETIAVAEQQIATIHQDFGKDLRVETYASLPPDRADQYAPEKRTEFFATWAYQRAKALGVDGVIVLICKDPAFLQVEVGDHTKQRAFTLANRDHLRDLLITAFKQRQFDDGLRQVITYYERTLRANLGASGPGARPSSAPAPGLPASSSAPQESPRSTPQVPSSFFWLVGLGLWVVFRRRNRSGAYEGTQSDARYTPYEYRGASPGMGYPPPDYRYGNGWGGGFGRGFGGGILGGLLGGWLGNRLAHRDPSSSPEAFPRTPDGGGGFDASPGPDFSDSSG
jgi:uncharacterized membrane protein YgcG